MSCFIDLALKRRCVVNVITMGNRLDRAMMHVFFIVESMSTAFRFWREVGLMLAFGEPVTSYLLYNGSASSSV